LLTSTSRRDRSWNFRKPSRLGPQRHLIVDAGGQIAEMRGWQVLSRDDGHLTVGVKGAVAAGGRDPDRVVIGRAEDLGRRI